VLTLRHGALSFSALSEGEGPLVLCLHGFPDHARSFRAVAPMLRGYEPSSQPADGDYHIVRMAEDVVAWLDQLGAERCHLVGHDWGAVIGYAVAALAPARLHTLTTLAVPPTRRMLRGLRRYPGQLRNSWYMLFFQLRGLADRVVARHDFAFLERLWRDWSPGWDVPPGELEALRETFRQPGVARAALGYYRAMADAWSPAGRQSAALLRSRIEVPTLAMTGALDGCMDTRLYDVVCDPADYHAGLTVERVPGAGHFLHQERPELVNPIILRWLSGAPPA